MSLGQSATEEDGGLITRLFGAIGKVWRTDEKYFDAVTGLRYVAFVMSADFLLIKELKCLWILPIGNGVGCVFICWFMGP